MIKDLIIIGAGGFGREVAWLVERINRISETWNILGFLDDNEYILGKEINGYKVLGKVKDVEKYPQSYYICAVGGSMIREKIIRETKAVKPAIRFATLIDPGVEMSDNVSLGEGVIICTHTIITVNISIGNHVIINLDCTVGHDAIIQDYVTLYPSVNISGCVDIGKCTEIGTGTHIVQGMVIGEKSIIGAGSVVVRDIDSFVTAVGIPAKVIKKHDIELHGRDNSTEGTMQ